MIHSDSQLTRRTTVINMIRELETHGKEARLTKNNIKMYILSKETTRKEIKINTVTEITYLEQLMTFKNRTEKEINVRIRKLG